MRAQGSDGALQVGATAGSYVTLLGMDMSRDQCDDLLGFSVHRRDHTADRAGYLVGQKAFRSLTDGRFDPPYSTQNHPIQGFQWADYTATPGREYTYTVTALRGDVAEPTSAEQVSLQVHTEHPRDGAHDIYFNRGAAASQQYAEEFKNQSPDDVGPRAFTWLSRGLYEALVDYVSSVDQNTALRICAYEFSYGPLLDVVAAARDAGADIQIIYDRRDPDIFETTERELAARNLTDIAHPRATSPSYISHNKFIVKLVNGAPRSVWTGGTNFSRSGIFGHSNVAHVVEDDTIAARYLQYWLALLEDPANAQLAQQVEDVSPLPQGQPPPGTIVLFSPRRDLAALQWYAARANAASNALFMTSAFGMNATFQAVYENSTAALRFALMESLVNRSLKGNNRRDAEARMQALRNMPQNTFAVGSLIKANALEGWLIEKLSGLTKNVHYVHNKFMLIDPLSADPIVVNGSANFSDASTRRNDENMLVVRGDRRVADVFITEYMRMYRHHAFRESQQFGNQARRLGRRVLNAVRQPRQLRTLARREGRWLIEPTDPNWPWWPQYFDNFSLSARRTYFADPAV